MLVTDLPGFGPALYSIDANLVTAEGIDHYDPAKHPLRRHVAGDVRRFLRRAALHQEVISDVPACVVITADVRRTARKYGERAGRYCFMEAGPVAQKILQQATALELAGLPFGAFNDDQATAALKLPNGQRVMYLLPIGPIAGGPSGQR